MAMRPAAETPTPMPAFVPLLNPAETGSGGVVVLVLVDVDVDVEDASVVVGMSDVGPVVMVGVEV